MTYHISKTDRNMLLNDFLVTSGVRQGSILRPLLSVLFINDSSCVTECGHLLYGDYLKLFKIITLNNGQQEN